MGSRAQARAGPQRGGLGRAPARPGADQRPAGPMRPAPRVDRARGFRLGDTPGDLRLLDLALDEAMSEATSELGEPAWVAKARQRGRPVPRRRARRPHSRRPLADLAETWSPSPTPG